MHYICTISITKVSFLVLGFIVLAWFSRKRKKFQENLFLFLILYTSYLRIGESLLKDRTNLRRSFHSSFHQDDFFLSISPPFNLSIPIILQSFQSIQPFNYSSFNFFRTLVETLNQLYESHINLIRLSITLLF